MKSRKFITKVLTQMLCICYVDFVKSTFDKIDITYVYQRIMDQLITKTVHCIAYKRITYIIIYLHT